MREKDPWGGGRLLPKEGREARVSRSDHFTGRRVSRLANDSLFRTSLVTPIRYMTYTYIGVIDWVGGN